MVGDNALAVTVEAEPSSVLSECHNVVWQALLSDS